MSNRRTKALASVIVVLWTGFYSQAAPVSDETMLSISSREPCAPGDENQSAAVSDDSDDASDDFVLLHVPLQCPPSCAVIALMFNNESTIRPHSFLAGNTLESQHILLRL